MVQERRYMQGYATASITNNFRSKATEGLSLHVRFLLRNAVDGL